VKKANNALPSSYLIVCYKYYFVQIIIVAIYIVINVYCAWPNCFLQHGNSVDVQLVMLSVRRRCMKKAVVVLVSLLAVACNSTPDKSNSAAAQTGVKQDAQTATAKADAAQAASNTVADHGIYFDTNKYAVAPAYAPMLRKEAEYLNSEKKGITLEGNCDERGSEEYNLALGQRRADAVKKLLMTAGMHANQIKTVSLGKEKPKASCHDESCWKENRRVDFIQG
jgi:peptidoglycan-associated lipoprotein